jgi:hypothetical protein
MKKSAQALGVAMIGILTLDCALTAEARAECLVQAPLRPVHRTYIRRDVVEPGVYEVLRKPSLYGAVDQTVEQPGAVIWHSEPAAYRTVPVRIRRSGGWAWQKQIVHGKPALCRVRLPATYVTVEKRVLVHPGRRWAERTPSSIGYVHRRILLRPYKNIAHFQRPYIAFSREHLAIQPEGYRWRPTAAQPDC